MQEIVSLLVLLDKHVHGLPVVLREVHYDRADQWVPALGFELFITSIEQALYALHCLQSCHDWHVDVQQH